MFHWLKTLFSGRSTRTAESWQTRREVKKRLLCLTAGIDPDTVKDSGNGQPKGSGNGQPAAADVETPPKKRSGVGLGWSIGPSFQGRYYHPETRILHSERSFIIEFLDAPYPLLKAIADELVRAFHQEVVLLKSHDTGEVEWLPDG